MRTCSGGLALPLTVRISAALLTLDALKLETPTACVKPCCAHFAKPLTKASFDHA